jgi:translocation and assembly module TamB
VIEFWKHTYLRIFLKTALWIGGVLLSALIVLTIALQFSSVQNVLIHALLSPIVERTHTRIEIRALSFSFPGSVELKGVFIEGRERDTLLAVGGLSANIDLIGLFSRTISISTLRIDSLTAHVTRSLPDSAFNFDFLLEALGSRASAAPPPKDTTSGGGWIIRLSKVSLRAINAAYNDDVAGLTVRIQLGSLDAAIDEFDITHQRFEVRSFSLDKTRADVMQSKSAQSSPSTPGSAHIGVGNASLANVHVGYENSSEHARYAADVGASNISRGSIDLVSHTIGLHSVSLEQTSVRILRPAPDTTAAAASASTGPEWNMKCDELHLRFALAQYDVYGAKQKQGFDENHVLLRDAAVDAADLYMSGTRAGGHLTHASLSDHSGLKINNVSFSAVVDSLHAQLSDFQLETPSTTIHQRLVLNYPSFSFFTQHPGDVRVNLTIDDTHIGIPDILLVAPSLPMKYSDKAIALGAIISGTFNDMRIEKFTARAGDTSAVDITGMVRGLPDVNNAYAELTIQALSTGRDDVRMFVPDTLYPKTITIPSFVTVTGAFTGSRKEFSTSTTIRTTIGTMKASASLAGGGSTNRWNTNVDIDNFNVGALLNDTSELGPVTLSATAEGSGLTKNDLTGHIALNVDKVTLLGYPYRHLTVEGTASAEMFDGNIELRDSNLVLLYHGSADISETHPAFKFTLECQGANLRNLGFTDDDMRVAGTLASDLTRGTINDVSGHVDVRNVTILKNGNRFIVDSLMFVSTDVATETHVSLNSPILDAHYDGSIAMSKLPDVLMKHLGRYFRLRDTTTAAPADSQSFTFTAVLKEQAALASIFFPSVTRLDAGAIEGTFNSAKGELGVKLDVNSLSYNGIVIDSLLCRVSSDPQQLRASVRVGTAVASQVMLTNCDLNGTIEHDSIDVSVRSTDRSGDTKILLAGIVKRLEDGYEVRLNHDGVMFQNRAWNVSPDNSLRIEKGAVIAHHVVLSDTGQAISLQSADESNARSPLTIDFSKFQIATLSQVVERDSGFAGGTINGGLQVTMLDKATVFTTDLSITNFVFGGIPVGDIALRAGNRAPDTYDLSMKLTGNGNQVGMHGTYKIGNGAGTLDLAIDVGALNLASLEPFTFGTVSRLTGTMTGALRVTGTPSTPSLGGTLNFDSTGFTPTLLASHLRLNHGQIGFDAQGMRLQTLTLIDTLKNTASIGGTITTSDYRGFGFDVSVSTKNFLLMNKPPDPLAMYYGKIFIDSDIRVKGSQTHPVIDVQAKLNKGTAVTFVVPESGPDVQGQEWIVSFIDRKNAPNPIMKQSPRDRPAVDSLKNKFGGIELTSNIEVTKESKLQILVDPISGDSLVVQGDATFSVGMYPNGSLSVTGRYDISGGSYLASFNNLLKRDFKIEKGSSLTWSGNPYDANVDITAVYTVKTSALDLVKDQISGMSQEERTKYRQELPIQVYLEMKGRLLAPEIKFRLDLAEDQRGALGGAIYAKLNQVNEEDSELNKQVFALLVLGRFVPSDPLALAGEGNSLTGLARSSVSSLLTSQLNALSQKYVKGVDVNVGLESGQDYSTGTAENRTQLQLALSKSLFEDRLTFQVGGNVDLEGPRSQQNSLNNFSGDIKVGYKLTEDGRWQMQVFRQRAYEGLLEGDLIETGVGLVFTIEYDTLVGLTLKPVEENTSEGTK